MQPDRKAFVLRILPEAVTIRPTTFDFLETLTVLPVVSLPPMPWITCGLAIATAVVAMRGFRMLRATTLAAPCLWVALSAILLAASALIEPQLEGITLSATRFAIATTTLCPLMAVLGAKRPQDRGWLWIVLSLWIVLVWPAAQAVVLPAGVRVELFIAWKLFLGGLIALGLLNYLPTIHWRAALLVALGQVSLLRDYLGLPRADSTEVSQLVATLCYFSAAVIAAKSRSTTQPLTTDLSSLTSSWLQFRNHYGAFWALRIFGRMNQSAEQRNWPLRLNWSGFAMVNDQEPSADQLDEIQQAMDSMLRRFVEK